MFIQTEDTPNPSTLKFIPGVAVLPGDTAEFTSSEEVKSSPLAARLLPLMVLNQSSSAVTFLAVTKAEQLDWFVLKPSILAGIMEHLRLACPSLRPRMKAAHQKKMMMKQSSRLSIFWIHALGQLLPWMAAISPFILLKMVWLHCRCAEPARGAQVPQRH